jgi:hypothetical protein
VTAIPGIHADDGDRQSSAFQVGPALVWEEVRVHSKKAICGLGKIHSFGVSWHPLEKRVRLGETGQLRSTPGQTVDGVGPATIPARRRTNDESGYSGPAVKEGT